MDTTPQYRVHRSGQKYRIDISYKAPKKRLITLPYEVWLTQMHGVRGCSFGRLQITWRLFSKEEILEILDELNPNHTVTISSLKVPMLKEWFKLEEPLENATLTERRSHFTDEQMFKLADDPSDEYFQ